MRAGIPSITAAGVSLLRGLSSLPGAPFDTANDRSMRALHTPLGRGALRVAGVLTSRAPGVHLWLRALSLGLLDHVALRTLAIDEALRAELARGVEQVVVLGAGLDARAWRMPELAGAVVYEVDHPATAPLKRARTTGRPALAREARFVTVDFERERVDEALAAAGHDVTRPTAWIWEGVTPYLAPEALTATLEVVAARSATGSLALVTYCTPEAVNVPSPIVLPVLAAFSLLGEPLRGRIAPDAIAAVAARLGLGVEHDTGARDWAARSLRGAPFPIVIHERLLALRR